MGSLKMKNKGISHKFSCRKFIIKCIVIKNMKKEKIFKKKPLKMVFW